MSDERSHVVWHPLGDRLREWDPAAEKRLEAGDAEEIRGQIRSALREGSARSAADRSTAALAARRWLAKRFPLHRPSPRFAGAIALGALLLLTVVAGWFLTSGRHGRGTEIPSPEVAELPPVDTQGDSEPQLGSIRLTTVEVAKEVDRASRAMSGVAPTPESPSPVVLQLASTEARPERSVRRLALRTRGGTKIYWTLDPSFSDELLAGGE